MDFHRTKNILSQEHTLKDYEWKGAVLFLCNEEFVFLMKRSSSMPTHGGQMAFFGGHKKDGEPDAWVVAQREYEEETSLSKKDIEFLGYLPVVMTTRLNSIVPVMAKLLITTEQFLSEVKSNGEWDHIIAYRWQDLLKEENWEFAGRFGYSQGTILFHPIKANSYLPQSELPHLLWGATAGMIWDFLRLYFK
jgi:8-oxo-dGTP pyrophosphatase MutT (NUDIX family)